MLVERVDSGLFSFYKELGLYSFSERFPWIGGDLQTLRDTFANDDLPLDRGEEIQVAVPALKSGTVDQGNLLSYLDLPADISNIRALTIRNVFSRSVRYGTLAYENTIY